MGAVASVHVDDGENDCPPIDKAKANQIFIAHAHQDIPALIARVRELEVELAAERKRIEGMESRIRDLSFTAYPERL
jgi:hypothetical protein